MKLRAGVRRVHPNVSEGNRLLTGAIMVGENDGEGTRHVKRIGIGLGLSTEDKAVTDDTGSVVEGVDFFVQVRFTELTLRIFEILDMKNGFRDGPHR